MNINLLRPSDAYMCRETQPTLDYVHFFLSSEAQSSD